MVGKNGSKFEDAKDGRKNYINWTGLGQVTFTENQTLLGLINILSSLLGAPVIDQTGIVGSHNFSLKFTIPEIRGQGKPIRLLIYSPPSRSNSDFDFQAATGPVEVLVIDHVESLQRTSLVARPLPQPEPGPEGCRADGPHPLRLLRFHFLREAAQYPARKVVREPEPGLRLGIEVDRLFVQPNQGGFAKPIARPRTVVRRAGAARGRAIGHVIVQCQAFSRDVLRTG